MGEVGIELHSDGAAQVDAFVIILSESLRCARNLDYLPVRRVENFEFGQNFHVIHFLAALENEETTVGSEVQTHGVGEILEDRLDKKLGRGRRRGL